MPRHPLTLRLALTVRALGIYAAVAGVITLIGWFGNWPRLTDWNGGGISMLPNSALAGALGGLVLVALSFGHRLAAGVLAGSVLVIGAGTLVQHLTGVSLGIDTILVQRDWGQRGTLAPGRMGPPAATSFTILGISLILAADGLARRRFSMIGALLVTGIAMLSLIGYLAGADLLFTLPKLTAIAFQTSTVLLALSLGLIALLPEQQPMKTILADTAAGLLARRALPFVIVVPILLGWLRLKGQHLELYDTAFGTALRTVVEVALLSALLWFAVRQINAYERELHRRSCQLEMFLETAAIGLRRVGFDGTILWANEAELKLLGYAPHEYIGHQIAEFHADQQVIADILHRLRRGERLLEYEARMVCKDGTLKDVLIDSSVLFEDGRFVHTQCLTRDVTNRKQAERAQSLLAEIVSASDDAIISKTLDGVIRSWNAGAERLFGYSQEEAVGQRIHLIIPPELHSQEEEILARLKRGERIEHFETVRQAKDGRRVDISLTVSPIRDASGRVVGASKVARDVTARKQAEALLAQHSRQLEEAVKETTARLEEMHARQRSTERFAAIGTLSTGLGHDISNLMLPMRANIDSLQTLIRPEASTEATDRLQSLGKSLDYLGSLARSLRLLAVDPESQIGAEREQLDLDAWWNETEPLLRTALSRRFSLHKDFDQSGRLARISTSKPMFTQAIFNLIQNAAQALSGPPMTPKGWVCVSAQTIPETANQPPMVRVIVADNGPGMSAEVRARCLEPFYTTKPRGFGTGMGLALVHGVVTNSGGTVEVRSQPGRGTAFVLTFPATAPPEPSAAPFPARTAIVRIDEARLRALAIHTLASMNFHVRDGGATNADILVINGLADDFEAAFLERNARSHVIRIRNGMSGHMAGPANPRIFEIASDAKLAEFRTVIQTLTEQMAPS